MANPPRAMDFREKILREGVLKHRQTSIALPRVSVILHNKNAFFLSRIYIGPSYFQVAAVFTAVITL